MKPTDQFRSDAEFLDFLFSKVAPLREELDLRNDDHDVNRELEAAHEQLGLFGDDDDDDDEPEDEEPEYEPEYTRDDINGPFAHYL